MNKNLKCTHPVPETGIKEFYRSSLHGSVFCKIISGWLFIFFSAFLMVSCSSMQEKWYKADINKGPEISPENVEILYEKPKKNHILLGELSKRFNPRIRKEKIIDRLKVEAGKRGADGIIVLPVTYIKQSWSIGGNEGVQPGNLQMDVLEQKVIMYRYR